ncbi:F-box/LRR-repeat protein 2-like isoform X2 [Portunus trituberculatus]|uniref:F-box/LRR-repeat protein 2-like isoform X2 n=1 Tax=Portunus trituberculatus TaxID=210409 RepID=UPI001E1D1A54|nr:F-box/LRR-repeat protein 2-like isoform X2 [Portunus trituberculatus]
MLAVMESGLRRKSMWDTLPMDLQCLSLPCMSDEALHGSYRRSRTTIDKLPDKVLLRIFSYLSHREIINNAFVCKRWRTISYNTQLWDSVSFRPDRQGLCVSSIDTLLYLIGARFGASLRHLEMPMDVITHPVLHELAAKCPNLTSMILDFSTAMQLHDFNDMQAFPTRLRTMCICLSEVIFMEGFMRKIYNFINGLEVLHLVGTYEKADEEEEEIYEVINVHKLKSATPNLKVVNLYGINFVDDSHIEAFSSNCIQLECLAVNFCAKVNGSSLKILLSRCKKLKCLLMQQCSLQNDQVMAAEWEKSAVQELDVTATDISTDCLVDLLTRIPSLRWLSAGQLDGFTDAVLKAWTERGNVKNLIALDLDLCDNLTEEALYKFLARYGSNLRGLVLSGIPQCTDSLCSNVMPALKNIMILRLGLSEALSYRLMGKIHVDGLLDNFANYAQNLERLEMSWDPDSLRFSDKSQKAIDTMRVRCLRLKCLVLADGKYYEIVKANYERADRTTVVRTATNCCVSIAYLLTHYKDLIFN